ncbi:hypothetical protein GJ496_007190 [Pomphorhynchus laevis]|nr:hypothetical protein GJ496_007190 [Pomphorhynchus laevis]
MGELDVGEIHRESNPSSSRIFSFPKSGYIFGILIEAQSFESHDFFGLTSDLKESSQLYLKQQPIKESDDPSSIICNPIIS